MTAQVGKLQPSVPRHFKHGVVQPCGKLLDERRLPASSRTIQIQGIKVVHKPDNHIPCRFMKAVMWVDSGGIQAGILESPNLVSCRYAAEDKPSIHFDGREGFQFLNVLQFHDILLLGFKNRKSRPLRRETGM